jgi:D-alanyl-D-alanine carboxypeptidase
VAAGGALVCALAWSPTCSAAQVVGDVADGTILQATDGDTPIASALAASLLLVLVVHEHLDAGTLSAESVVPIVPAPRGPAPGFGDGAELSVDELLHLLILTGNPSAAQSLAAAVGPGVATARFHMMTTAVRLGMTATSAAARPEGETLRADAPLRTSARDLTRLGLAVAGRVDLRRRLELDGVPIADGRVIVRATAPLITVADGSPPRSPGPQALVLGRADELELLAVGTGVRAHTTATQALEASLVRYERRSIVRAGQEVGPLVYVRGGIIPRFTAVAVEPFALTTARDAPLALTARLQLPAQIDAPVEVHQTVGELVVELDGTIVAVIPLAAPRAIAPRRWLGAMATFN